MTQGSARGGWRRKGLWEWGDSIKGAAFSREKSSGAYQVASEDPSRRTRVPGIAETSQNPCGPASQGISLPVCHSHSSPVAPRLWCSAPAHVTSPSCRSPQAVALVYLAETRGLVRRTGSGTRVREGGA